MSDAPAILQSPREGLVEVHETREAWLEARRRGVGASEVPALFALDVPQDRETGEGIRSPRGPLAVYSAKVAGESDDDSLAMAFGRRFEAPLAEWYEEETGRAVSDPGPWTMTWHPTLPLFATLDRRVVDGSRPLGDEAGVLECKLTWPSKAWEWRDEPPLAAQLQLQAQLAVTGCSWGSLAVLIGGMSPKYRDVARHDRLIAGIEKRVRDFWAMVERREPPPADALDETASALARLFPGRRSEQSIALADADAEHLRLADELEDVRGRISVLEERETLLSNTLRREMGDATLAYLADGTRLKWQRKSRGGSLVRLKRLGRWKGKR